MCCLYCVDLSCWFGVFVLGLFVLCLIGFVGCEVWLGCCTFVVGCWLGLFVVGFELLCVLLFIVRRWFCLFDMRMVLLQLFACGFAGVGLLVSLIVLFCVGFVVLVCCVQCVVDVLVCFGLFWFVLNV